MKRGWKVVIFVIIILIALVSFFRNISPRQIDDVTPGIPCEQEYLEKSDILWIIPNYNNSPISKNKEWCEYILSLNKTLGIHGVQHYYPEFEESLTQEYIQGGINSFEECFGYAPTMFKPPKLDISKENKKLIKENGMKMKRYSNQFFHKVYHCSNTGTFPNRFHDLF